MAQDRLNGLVLLLVEQGEQTQKVDVFALKQIAENARFR